MTVQTFKKFNWDEKTSLGILFGTKEYMLWNISKLILVGTLFEDRIYDNVTNVGYGKKYTSRKYVDWF